jgi:hypothetical protein
MVGRRLVLIALVALAALLPLASAGVRTAEAHYIYTCPNYRFDPVTGSHTLPSVAGCDTDPHRNHGVHQWAAERARLILFYDGYLRYSTLLQSPIRIGSAGLGRRHVDLLIDGIIAADTQLNGCTNYGASVGWPIGDHMLNPHRHFGLRSYYLYPSRSGWHGWDYPRTESCASAPQVRSNSARMADEFFSRAQREWRAFQPGNAMYNLGVALHMVQDATVPSHVHPEERTRDHFPPLANVPLDSYPAWAAANRTRHAVSFGGWYFMPPSRRGVTIAPTAGGWVYWMAAESYPYSYWKAGISAVSQSAMGCNVSRSPEACPAEAQMLLRMTQRASAGFIRFFFQSVGYSVA